MSNEKNTEIVRDANFQQVVIEMMLQNFEAQKKSTLNKYRILNANAKKGQILFAGSSLMEWFPIGEMQFSLNLDTFIYNRGVAGATTSELMDAMDVCIFDLEPSKIFINIGSNDVGSVKEGYKKEHLIANYDQIMRQMKSGLPDCQVYVMAYYPINAKADFGIDPSQKAFLFATRTNENIREANESLKEPAENHGFYFINLNDGLEDEEGNLKAEYSTDGIHLWPNAYEVILKNMKRYL